MKKQNAISENVSDVRNWKKTESPDAVSNKKNSSKKKPDILSNLYFLFIPAALLLMELLVKFLISGSIFDDHLIYIVLFSLSYGSLLSAICGIFSGTVRRTLTKITLFVMGAFLAFHLGYYKNFQCHFSFANMSEAQNAITDFSSLIFDAAKNIWYAIILLMLPLVVFWIFGKKFSPQGQKNFTASSVSATAAVLLYFCGLWLTASSGLEYSYDGYTYKYAQSNIEATYDTFGIITTARLDLKQLIFGAPEEPLYIPTASQVSQEVSSSYAEYGYNVLDIDFDELAEKETDESIKAMHQYVAAQQPTQKNEYTGMFEGKNLIMLSLEGFSGKVIDPEFTPTLYKMTQQGFKFNNYYHSSWGGSTASGEYTNLTGNVYNTPACLEMSASTSQPFTMANQLAKKGYSCYGYHNNTYTYYHRNLSHPNFGYTFKGLGNGLVLPTDHWPASDLEMAQATIDDYINQQPFHAYYMTVSGHANYYFTSNYMSSLHHKDLPEKYKNYSESLKAYLACQYEVELMLEYLVERLDQAGILDDTVFVMAPDHYPYGLKDPELSKLYGLSEKNIRINFDIYKNSLIIWNSSMETPVTVDKACCASDILPTLLNLWGIDYDSRLLIGKDILSNSIGIAHVQIFQYDWITDEGQYYQSQKRFIPNESCTMTKDEIKTYTEEITQIVKARTGFSKQILEKDYYSYIPDL